MAEIKRVLIALIVRVGVGLAKNLIQVHALDAACRRVVARAIKRDRRPWSTRPGPRSGATRERQSVTRVQRPVYPIALISACRERAVRCAPLALDAMRIDLLTPLPLRPENAAEQVVVSFSR